MSGRENDSEEMKNGDGFEVTGDVASEKCDGE